MAGKVLIFLQPMSTVYTRHPVRRFFEILKYEHKDIGSIYFYAILSGLVQLSLPLGIQSIISFVLGGSISTSIVLLIILVVVGVFINGLLLVNQMKLIEKIQQQLFVRYSFQYAHHIPKLDLKKVDKYYLPEMVNRFFDTVSLQKAMSKILMDVPVASLQILFGLLLLMFYHPVFIFFGVLLLLVVFLMLWITGPKGFETNMQESNYKYKVAGYLEELARVVTTFKFSRNSHLHIEHTDKYVTGYLKSRTAHFKILLIQYWTLVAFKVLITAAMLIVGTLLLVNQQLNIGQFIAAEIVIIMVMSSVEKLIGNLDKVYEVMTSLEKISKLTDQPEEKNGTVVLADKEGISIKARELSFSYQDDKFVLKNISFDVNAGEKVCVMGTFSSGKSSLLRVLSAAYLPDEGIFTFNDIPVVHYNLSSLRKNMGVMLHHQEIFEGTLLENILMEHEISDIKEVQQLAEMVSLKSFLENQPEGYHLKLQPVGKHLSGKIARKIMLVRALVKKPKLLLLEDPWIGLETENAIRIKKYLLQEIPHTTAFIISNDKSFAAQCDKVIYLVNGELKAFGTWEQVADVVK